MTEATDVDADATDVDENATDLDSLGGDRFNPCHVPDDELLVVHGNSSCWKTVTWPWFVSEVRRPKNDEDGSRSHRYGSAARLRGTVGADNEDITGDSKKSFERIIFAGLKNCPGLHSMVTLDF